MMTRHGFLRRLLGVIVAPWGVPVLVNLEASGTSEGIQALDKPVSEWRKLLSRNAYAVLFKEDTERPYSSPLNEEKGRGTYLCAACYLPLFDSTTKYESGTGWPSFYAPLEGHLGTKRDFRLIWPRTEYHCVRCGGHQGHLFKDGPRPTGQRWCNNGLALQFVPAGQRLPELRT